MQDEDDEDDEEEESEQEELGPREMPNRTTRGRRMGQVSSHGLQYEIHCVPWAWTSDQWKCCADHQFEATLAQSVNKPYDRQDAVRYTVPRHSGHSQNLCCDRMSALEDMLSAHGMTVRTEAMTCLRCESALILI